MVLYIIHSMPDLSQPELCLFIYVAHVGFEVFYDNHLCYLLFHFQIGGIKGLLAIGCRLSGFTSKLVR